jgi:hypothetical protein
MRGKVEIEGKKRKEKTLLNEVRIEVAKKSKTKTKTKKNTT